LVWIYVQTAEDRAQAAEAPVTVLVATADIAAGTPASQLTGRTTMLALPKRLAATAVQSVDQISGQVASTLIVAGSPLYRGQFGGTADHLGPFTHHPGKIVISLSLGNPQRVAHLAHGMQVAIFLTANAKAGSGTKLLLSPVLVVDVGGDARGQSGSGVGGQIVSLEVDQAQAERLIQAQAGNVGQLWFALVGPDSQLTADQAPATGLDPAN
jgi:Flp pilus assembly protein CpaB